MVHLLSLAKSKRLFSEYEILIKYTFVPSVPLSIIAIYLSIPILGAKNSVNHIDINYLRNFTSLKMYCNI